MLFSEPTGGIFEVTQRLTQGDPALWQINQVASSGALTGLILWWGLGLRRQQPDSRLLREWRVFVTFALVLAASAALGFNYTRDRLGGVAVVFYAVAAYHAVRCAAERAIQASRAVLACAGVGLLLLGTAWEVRAIGTLQYVRETAWHNRKEWIVDLAERRIEFANRPIYLRTMEDLVDQGSDPSVGLRRLAPRWTWKILGER